MFNLIVGGSVTKDWQGGDISGWGGRFLTTSEGTSQDVVEILKPSGNVDWKAVTALPALITPERQSMSGARAAQVGTITRLLEGRRGDISFHFSPYRGIPRLSEHEVNAVLDRLEAGELWHYRTHWAVHEGDLLAAIAEIGALTAVPSGQAGNFTSAEENLTTELEGVLETRDSPAGLSQAKLNGRVFIVHGHDEARKHELGRFLHALVGSEPIILHEQSNQGMTVIEKFEHHAGRAGFAVALLTADDLGRDRNDSEDNLRARQNVVFEAGYFAGRLGRGRVVLLHDQGVELPSDLAGVVYIPLDSGAWRSNLARELHGSGFEIEWSALGRY